MEHTALQKDLKLVRRLGLRGVQNAAIPNMCRETVRVFGLVDETVSAEDLERLLRLAVTQLEGNVLGQAVEYLFGLVPSVRGRKPSDLRKVAASAIYAEDATSSLVDKFRKTYEDRQIFPELAAIIVRMPKAHEERVELSSSPEQKRLKRNATSNFHSQLSDGSSAFAQLLRERQVSECSRYLRGLDVGHLILGSQDRLMDTLLLMSRNATRELFAVDSTALKFWFERDFAEYLDVQLGRTKSGEISLTRLRLVRDGELEDPESVERMRAYIEMHDEAGARIEFCIDSRTAFQQRLVFFPTTGCLLMDPDQNPALLAGWMGDEGYMENAHLYLGDAPEIDHYRDDIDTCLDRISEKGWTSFVRQLVGLGIEDDDPARVTTTRQP